MTERISASPWALRAWAVLVLLSQTTWAGWMANSISDWLFGPGPAEIGSPPFLLQKGYHVFLFGVFGWLIARSGAQWSAAAALGLAAGFGVFAECLQWLAPGRHPQVSDALINIVSAGTGWALSSRRLPAGR